MARSLRGIPRYDPAALAQWQPSESDILVPVPCFDFKGMNIMVPLSIMAPGICRLVRNLGIRYGSYKTRDGTSVIGTQSGQPLLFAVDVARANGANQMTRFRTGGVDVFLNGVWTQVNGDAFTGLQSSPFAYTGWGDTLVFSAGQGKAWSLAFDPLGLTELTDAPVGIIHLATFGGRIVASLASNQVQWSVKDDDTNWHDLGSGFEDLKSAPGGRPDVQTAVIPVTDEQAYCVRSNSTWQMSLTGNFDSPFAFSKLYDYVGSKYPQTVAAIPRGFIALGEQQIWKVTPDGYEDIGIPIKDLLSIPANYLQAASATYDVLFGEYRLVLPGPNSLTAQTVLRYNLENKAWTEDVYPFPIRSAAYTLFAAGLTIDELSGIIDSLIGSIDALGIDKRNAGTIYAMDGTQQWVARDDISVNDDPLRDVDAGGNRVASGFRLETGDIFVRDESMRKDVVEVVLWYESTQDVVVTLDYNYDGVTWNTMVQKTLPATTRVTPVTFRKYADRKFFQFAVSTEATPTVRLVRLEAFVREGARITDAN